MRYRCVNSSKPEWFVVGRTYTVNDLGYIMDENGYEWVSFSRYAGVREIDFSGCGVTMEFVLEEDSMADIIKFSLDEVENGDVLELNDGERLLVLRDTRIGHVFRCNAQTQSGVVDNLNRIGEYVEGTGREIIKHYKPRSYAAFCNTRNGVNMTHYTLFWEKAEEVKELTVSEISKLLGYEVKVIGEG